MKSLNITLVSDNELSQDLVLDQQVVLLIKFADNITLLPPIKQSASIHLKNLTPTTQFEVWRSECPIQTGEDAHFQYAKTDDFVVASCAVDIASMTQFEDIVEQQYHKIFAFIKKQGYASLVRMWNYFPSINHHHTDSDIERYKHFCSGRYKAFAQQFEDFQIWLPSATAIGTQSVADDTLHIYFIAAKSAGLHIENPRQISAYQYPKQYGKHSPLFARATYQQWDDEHAHLFISGTASITGHQSREIGDCHKQIQEIFNNINALLNHPNLPKCQSSKLSLLKVYVRESQHMAMVQKMIKNHTDWYDYTVFLQGDICRQELLIEIEGIWEMYGK